VHSQKSPFLCYISALREFMRPTASYIESLTMLSYFEIYFSQNVSALIFFLA
jgi:hypothetical protein